MISEAPGAATGPGPRGRLIGWAIHAAVALLYVGVAVAWTSPLAAHFTTHIPGRGPGDNVAFLWNFWWTRFALAHELDIFHTTHLFAPEGTSLALHTHVALPAWVAATALGSVAIITAHNVALVGTLALNGLTVFWLVRRDADDIVAAGLAGVLFAGSAFAVGHVQGHFNVISMWPLPLIALAARSMAAGSRGGSLALGALLGITPYVDYYYAVFGVAVASTLIAFEHRVPHLSTRGVSTTGRVAGRALPVAMIGLGVIIGMILTTGGRVFSVGPVRIDATDAFNAQQVFGLLVLVWAWQRWQPRVTLRPAGDDGPGRSAVPVTAAAVWTAVALASLVSAPLWLRIGALAVRGDYAAQPLVWRNAPQGVDLASLVLGPPAHWLAPLSGALYTRLGIDPIERSAWIGVVPLLLVACALRTRTWALTARWVLLGSGALLWALGPHLTILGSNTGFVLPQALLRYLPVLSNARIPGRAMAVVLMCVSALAALGLAEVRRRRFGRTIVAVCALVLGVELWPGPIALFRPDSSVLDDTLRDQVASGAVLELPLGIRDGFGEDGALDVRHLWYQVRHERPLVGGFVARLSPRARASMLDDPLLAPLLLLSSKTGGALSDRPAVDIRVVTESLRRHRVAFVMLDRTSASADLQAFVAARLPVAQIARDERRTLYRVVPPDGLP